MANKKTNYKASNKQGVAGIKFFALLLALVFIGTAVACGFGWWQVVKLREQIAALTPADEEEGSPENLIITVNEYDTSSPILLRVANSSEDGGIGGNTITATVYDTDNRVIENEPVNFTLSWNGEKNESVYDYVTMHVVGNTATFFCSNPFDTQIIATCASVSDPTKSVTATIDYVNSVGSIRANLGYGDITILNGDSCPIVKSEWVYKDFYTSNYWLDKGFLFYGGCGFSGISSVDNEVLYVSVNISFSDAVMNYLNDMAGVCFEIGDVFGNHTQTYTLINPGSFVCQTDLISGLFDETALNAFISGLDDSWANFKQVLLNTDNQLEVEVDLTMLYGGAVTIWYTVDINFYDYIGEVQADNNSIYFGVHE